jgi:hypothetical protein
MRTFPGNIPVHGGYHRPRASYETAGIKGLSPDDGLPLYAMWPPTLVFNYPTPTDPAGYLRTRTVSQTDHLPVLKELDLLESALSEIDRNSDIRVKIVARLEAIAKGFRAGTTDNAPADDELEEATDDEMFDLIDQELGLSR